MRGFAHSSRERFVPILIAALLTRIKYFLLRIISHLLYRLARVQAKDEQHLLGLLLLCP